MLCKLLYRNQNQIKSLISQMHTRKCYVPAVRALDVNFKFHPTDRNLMTFPNNNKEKAFRTI
jgi:hypothetical protein